MTAVDFLVEGIRNLTGLNIANDEPIIEQAKEMERQQIEKAYNSAVPFKFGKECYEKTYKHQSNKESL